MSIDEPIPPQTPPAVPGPDQPSTAPAPDDPNPDLDPEPIDQPE